MSTDQTKENATPAAIGVGPDTTPERAWRKWAPQFEHAAQLGDPLYVVPEGSDVNPDSTFTAIRMYPKGGTFAWELGEEVPLAALRDATGRMDYTPHLTQINTPRMREVTGDKAEFGALFPEVAIPTLAFSPAEGLTVTELDALPGDELVIKPAHGLESKDITFISKADFDATKFESGDYIVQPYVDATKLPPGLRGATPEDDVKISSAQGVKELRMFTGLPTEDKRPIPVVKLAREDGRTMASSFYVSPDPESVPQQAYDVANYVADKLRQITGDQHIFAAVDLIYNEELNDFYVVEVNTKEPALPNTRDHPRSGRAVHQGIVKLLRQAAVIKVDDKLEIG